MPPHLPDVALLDGVVAPRVLDAMRVAAVELRNAGIRFALAGGLAVGAHGHPRATKDVAFLVGSEAFRVHGGGVITLAPGVPIQVADVPIDSLSIQPDEQHLVEALEAAPTVGGIPVLPATALVYLKLKSPRRQDAADIVALLRVASNPAAIRAYVVDHAPDLLAKHDSLAAEAEAGE